MCSTRSAVSKLWRQIITDVFNVPTCWSAAHRRAYGDAILAGVATGILPGFQVAKQWVQYVAQMDPKPSRHRYMEYFSLYRRLYSHVKEDFQALAALVRFGRRLEYAKYAIQRNRGDIGRHDHVAAHYCE